MKRLYMVLLLVCLLLIGGVLTGCGKAADSTDSATTAEQNNSLTDNPSVEAVKTAIQQINTITEIAIVTEDNDPNNQLGKQGGYTGCLYFTDKNAPQIEGGDVIKNGTKGGGSIEIYANSKDAKKRDDYLATFDGSPLASGSHTVVGTLVVRTSSEFTASQQKALESQIVDVLNGESVADKTAESTTRGNSPVYEKKTYNRLTFDIDQSWDDRMLETGAMQYYPHVVETTGFISSTWSSSDNDLNSFTDEELRAELDKRMTSIINENNNPEEISRGYLNVGGQKAIRFSFYFDYSPGQNDINKDKRGVYDIVIVFFDDGVSTLYSYSTETEYETMYNPQIERALSSVNLDPNYNAKTAVVTSESVSSGSIRPEFKEALDSYEAFFDKYIAFMTTYNEGNGSLDTLSEYTEFMTQYADTMQKMGDLQSEDLTDEELAYYLEVTTRISTKLLSVSGQ